MYASTTFVISAILALVRVAVATPPACLIAAMGAQTNPADLKALCGTLESQVVGNITEKCSGDAESAAISVYAATCLASQSVTISITSSASSTRTGSVTAKTTGTNSQATGAATTTGTAKVTGTATGTAASSTGTSGAGSNSPQYAMAILAAGVAGQYLL